MGFSTQIAQLQNFPSKACLLFLNWLDKNVQKKTYMHKLIIFFLTPFLMRFCSDPIRLLYVYIDVIAIYTNKYCLS